MPKTIKEERLRWILPILNKERSIKDIACVCPHSERSIKRWLKAYRDHGEHGLEPRSTRPKTQPNETPIRIKEEILNLRKKTGLCALKLHWKLEKKGIEVHPRTVGKILKKEGVVRKYRTKKVKYTYIRAERIPGELVEIDVKYVPGPIQGVKYYQYTAIDTASRWRYLEIFDEYTTHHSKLFLKNVIEKFPYTIQSIKTDNHATFTNYYLGTNKRSDLTIRTLHSFDQFCKDKNIIHYLIDPGKPAQNGTVERSHREDEEKFYQRYSFSSIAQLKKKLRTWNEYYNNLEHCGLKGKTPNEMLKLKVPNVRT